MYFKAAGTISPRFWDNWTIQIIYMSTEQKATYKYAFLWAMFATNRKNISTARTWCRPGGKRKEIMISTKGPGDWPTTLRLGQSAGACSRMSALGLIGWWQMLCAANNQSLISLDRSTVCNRETIDCILSDVLRCYNPIKCLTGSLDRHPCKLTPLNFFGS